MKSIFFCVVILLSIYHYRHVSASFTHGQPCSERNTAYLYVMTWRLPDKNEINCVDITGFKKSISIKMDLSNYTRFIQMVAGADTLYADHMNMKRFPIAIVHSLPKLETIDMSVNNMSRIPQKMYKIVPKLAKLLLSENKVVIPKKKPLLSSPTLQTLMLSENGISNIYKSTFTKLPALEVLYLDSNQIRFISPAMFSAMKNLKYLHLGQNYLSKIPPRDVMPRSITHFITKSQRRIKRRSVGRRRIGDMFKNNALHSVFQ